MGDQQRKDDFLELVSLARGRVFGYLFSLVQNLADSEDLFQQTILVLWEKFDDFQPGTDFAKWACTVAHYQAASFLRRKQRSPVYFSDEVVDRLSQTQQTIESSEVADRHRALGACVEKLPMRDRRLLELCYGGDRSIKQAAEQVGRSLQGTYNALSRIRRVLFACISRTLAEEERP